MSLLVKREGVFENPFLYKKFKVKSSPFDQFMTLDKSVLNSLSIFYDSKQKEENSIFKFFSQFLSTKMGGRVLKKWLMQP